MGSRLSATLLMLSVDLMFKKASVGSTINTTDMTQTTIYRLETDLSASRVVCGCLN